MAIIKWRWTGSKYVAAGVGVAIAVAAWFVPGSVVAGTVAGVVDGDTVRVQTSEGTVTVRVWGVDCPETRQPFGRDAAEFTAKVCGGEVVSVRVKAKDRYGRIVGEVVTSTGLNVGHELLRAGLAWWYEEYAPRDMDKKRLQFEARNGKMGLWRQRSPTPPWLWRRARQSWKRETSPACTAGDVRVCVGLLEA